MYQVPERIWDCVSALQKSIRRGLEEDAGRFFFEIADSGNFSIAINRLAIISQEDIGMADMQTVIFVHIAVEQAKYFYKIKNDAWRLMAANVILALSRANKSREADHFQCVCAGRNKRDKLSIPDYAYDKHTKKGKKMGRGVEHFRTVGTLLKNGSEDKYADEAYNYWTEDAMSPQISMELSRGQISD